MVNFFPPQQGFWGNQSYRTAMFVFAEPGWTAVSVSITHLVLSTSVSLSVLLFLGANLTFFQEPGVLGSPPSFPVFPAFSQGYVQSGLWQIFAGFTRSCESKELNDRKWGYLRANPVLALRKQLRVAYSADLFSTLALLKKILFDNEGTWGEKKWVYNLVVENQASETYPFSPSISPTSVVRIQCANVGKHFELWKEAHHVIMAFAQELTWIETIIIVTTSDLPQEKNWVALFFLGFKRDTINGAAANQRKEFSKTQNWDLSCRTPRTENSYRDYDLLNSEPLCNLK